MIEINLTESNLFLSLLENYVEGKYIDLHNEYNCEKMVFDKNKDRFSFYFKRTEQATAGWSNVSVVFEGTLITSYTFLFEALISELTLDNFYRGRFLDGELLKEYSQDGKGYFYVSFCEDISFELFANKVLLYAYQIQ